MFGFLKTILGAVLLLTRVPKAISMIMEGIIQEVTEIPVGAAIGAISMSRLIQTFWVFGISNFFCGMKMMGSFTSCALYYVLEVIGTILYLIPMLLMIAQSLIFLDHFSNPHLLIHFGNGNVLNLHCL